jgi:hypothetical protein
MSDILTKPEQKVKPKLLDDHFDEPGLADYLGKNVQFVRNLARKGEGPPYLVLGKHGRGEVRIYPKVGVPPWLQSRLRRPPRSKLFRE